MTTAVPSQQLVNLSPLPPRAAERKAEAPILPVDEIVYSREGSSPSTLAKVGLAAMSLVAGAGALAAPCPAQQVQTQVQDQTALSELLQSYSRSRGDQMRFYVHIGIIGQDVEITREKALEHIGSGHDVILRTEHTLNAAAGATQVTLNSQQDTHIHSVDKLRKLIDSEADRLSQSEAEHLTKVLRSYHGIRGDYLYQIREVENDDGMGRPTIKTISELSPFEAATQLLGGREVAFVATPLSRVIEAIGQGKSPEMARDEVEIISDQQDLLSLPQSFDAALEAWHPRIPGSHGPEELCWTIQERDQSVFQCEQAVLRR